MFLCRDIVGEILSFLPILDRLDARLISREVHQINKETPLHSYPYVDLTDLFTKFTMRKKYDFEEDSSDLVGATYLSFKSFFDGIPSLSLHKTHSFTYIQTLDRLKHLRLLISTDFDLDLSSMTSLSHVNISCDRFGPNTRFPRNIKHMKLEAMEDITQTRFLDHMNGLSLESLTTNLVFSTNIHAKELKGPYELLSVCKPLIYNGYQDEPNELVTHLQNASQLVELNIGELNDPLLTQICKLTQLTTLRFVSYTGTDPSILSSSRLTKFSMHLYDQPNMYYPLSRPNILQYLPSTLEQLNIPTNIDVAITPSLPNLKKVEIFNVRSQKRYVCSIVCRFPSPVEHVLCLTNDEVYYTIDEEEIKDLIVDCNVQRPSVVAKRFSTIVFVEGLTDDWIEKLKEFPPTTIRINDMSYKQYQKIKALGIEVVLLPTNIY